MLQNKSLNFETLLAYGKLSFVLILSSLSDRKFHDINAFKISQTTFLSYINLPIYGIFRLKVSKYSVRSSVDQSASRQGLLTFFLDFQNIAPILQESMTNESNEITKRGPTFLWLYNCETFGQRGSTRLKVRCIRSWNLEVNPTI